MEPKTICQWCGSASGNVVRGVISGCRRTKEFVQRLCRRQPSEPVKIKNEEPEPAEGVPEKLQKITFTYHDLDAKEVKLAGDFTNWKQKPFTKKSSGDWSITIELLPGKYYYKYVVDNIWIRDPLSSKSEPDKYGDRRSIIDV
jgi:1,4-alpha-glucan branching enzyme